MTTNNGNEGWWHAGAMLVSGTLSTVLTKTQYSLRVQGTEQCVVDVAGVPTVSTLCTFDKPWFSVLEMKLAMALCLVFLYARKAVRHRPYLETPVMRLQHGGKRYITTPEFRKMRQELRDSKHVQYGSTTPRDSTATETKVSVKTIVLIAIPAVLDLLQTVLSGVALLWISSSIYQMARGSVIIFSAFLSVKYMGKTLKTHHYVSIGIVAVAVAIVGWAGTRNAAAASSASGSSPTLAIFGMILVVVSQLFTAVQIVVEEHMMLSLNVSPMLLVGLEGLWGLVFFVPLVPILTLTPTATTEFAKIWHEDFADTWVKISHSSTLVWSIVAYIVAVGILNVTGNYVTKHLSAVLRSIIETLRTLGVWVLGLVVFYAFQWRGASSPGEEWTASSWIELAGFVLMVLGTLAYKEIIRLPLQIATPGRRGRGDRAFTASPFMNSGMHA